MFLLLSGWVKALMRCRLCTIRYGKTAKALSMLSHDSHSITRMSLPKIIRVTAVFLLVLCLFAMIFMELFGLTKYGLETNEHNNFRDYGNALLLLIRVATGEAWVIIFHAVLLLYRILIVIFSLFRILL